jgi:hypothetical protein
MSAFLTALLIQVWLPIICIYGAFLLLYNSGKDDL